VVNWVAVPRYTLEPLWFVILACGHARADSVEPALDREMACMHCRYERGWTDYSPVRHIYPLPRPLR
jgi:hypothetical protein